MNTSFFKQRLASDASIATRENEAIHFSQPRTESRQIHVIFAF